MAAGRGHDVLREGAMLAGVSLERLAVADVSVRVAPADR